jgi:hypothetical protein
MPEISGVGPVVPPPANVPTPKPQNDPPLTVITNNALGGGLIDLSSVPAITGINGHGPGVSGVGSAGAAGVEGISDTFDGVHGESKSNQHAGISGINNSGGPGVFGSASQWDGVHGESQSNQHAGVSGINSSGGPGIWATGKPAGHFEGDVTVTGDVILSGQDCAEHFAADLASNVEPGTVMVIAGGGGLEPSSRAYDKRVAGVVSGAGGLRPGIILGGQRREQGVTVALVGKVYCKVDATQTPIEIGDLLTTSDNPGHAMKADDPAKAFGAVIGNALQGIPLGRHGLIPILVGLQ